MEANAILLEMLGYEAEEALGLPWEAVTAPEYRAAGRSQLSELQKTGRGHAWHTELTGSDGRRIRVLAQAARVSDVETRFLCLVMRDPGDVEDRGMQRLAGGLLNRFDDERRRIARELHDTIAQDLAALTMNLALLDGTFDDTSRSRAILSECAALTGASLKEVRSLSYALHPPLLDELGLESALRLFLDTYKARTGVEATLAVRTPVGRLPPEVELAAFRIAQESLLNVHIHSGSQTARVELARNGPEFELCVRDWGTGILAGFQSDQRVGIAGMCERARLAGGAFEVVAADPGTMVRSVFRMEL